MLKELRSPNSSSQMMIKFEDDKGSIKLESADFSTKPTEYYSNWYISNHLHPALLLGHGDPHDASYRERAMQGQDIYEMSLGWSLEPFPITSPTFWQPWTPCSIEVKPGQTP
jgi:hypothetical protein